jgi:hypothetical protein
MRNRHRVIRGKSIIVASAEGSLDLAASKSAIREITADPEYSEYYEVLLDLRNVDCKLSITDIYEIVTWMAFPEPALPTRKKIAVLMQAGESFDHAGFLDHCANNRGLLIHSFTEEKAAIAWLDADVPQEVLD